MNELPQIEDLQFTSFTLASVAGMADWLVGVCGDRRVAVMVTSGGPASFP